MSVTTTEGAREGRRTPRWASPLIWLPIIALPIVVVVVLVFAITRDPAPPRIEGAATIFGTAVDDPARHVRMSGKTTHDEWAITYRYWIDDEPYFVDGMIRFGSEVQARRFTELDPAIVGTVVYDPDDPERAYVDDRPLFR
jgi:hypothetical protein